MFDRLGAPVVELFEYVGGITQLVLETLGWIWKGLVLRKVRFGRFAFYTQIVRVGVRSVAVIALVSACIGLILALQMAPPQSVATLLSNVQLMTVGAPSTGM